MTNHIELNINNTNTIKDVYDSIITNILNNDGIIESDNYKFNNYTGDITKNIKWTWAINSKSIKLLSNCFDSITNEVNKKFNNEFFIYGASFIIYNK